jgi:plasmid stabilization system protein ParE
MTSLPVKLHPKASEEARSARRWYSARDRVAADKFLAELDRAVLAIVEHPERWPSYLHGTRRLHFRRFPYSIVYRVQAANILVVAVAHDRQRPGYWLARK